MAVCLVPHCPRTSHIGGMCCGHYKRRWNGNFDDSPIHEWPPIPAGLAEACTLRLEAVRDGRDAEARASRRLLDLIASLFE